MGEFFMNGEAGKAGKHHHFMLKSGKMAGKPLQNSSILAGFFSVGEWQPCLVDCTSAYLLTT